MEPSLLPGSAEASSSFCLPSAFSDGARIAKHIQYETTNLGLNILATVGGGTAAWFINHLCR
jgi:hypothetical protein